MISVIIPIYNAEDYIEKAVLSVLDQTEVSEIILIDDGSTDLSKKICESLVEENNKIKLFAHRHNINLGRSASRNLGISNATSKYIAFLDADDFYLENRFANDLSILENNKNIDGVYNAIGANFYREYSKKEKLKLELTTVREKLKPNELFEKMGPIGHLGYFSGIGLTVRKSIFDKVGMFNEKLEVAEDTELWLKMAMKTILAGGVLDKPLAMRGVHHKNISFKNQELYNKNYFLMFDELLKWSIKNKIKSTRINKLYKKAWEYKLLLSKDIILNFRYWIFWSFNYPKAFSFKEHYFKFPIVQLLKNVFK